MAEDEFSFLPEQARSLGDALGAEPAVPSARRVSLEADGGRVVSALVYGDAAPRIVLLHGAGLNAHTWDATVLALGAPVLAIDLPGHGDSSWRDDADYSPATIAPDVARAIEAHADAPVVLVGQSLGGLTAAAVAAARPELVAHVVLVDITPSIDNGGPAELRRFYEKQEFSSREELVEHAISFGLGGTVDQARRGVHLNSRVRPDGVVEWKHHFASLAATALPGDAANATGIIDRASGWRDLATLRAPVTLVRGTRGFVTQDAADAFVTHMRRARSDSAEVVALDAPHNVQEVAPIELADLIRSRSRGA